MASQPSNTPQPSGGNKEVAVTGRELSKVPEPKHGNPAENLGPNESVIGVRVGSEAAVESGTGPVLPAVGGGLSELTRVRNKDLQERDEKELEKRGPGDAIASVSMTFPGLMMVEVDGKSEPHSGSFSGGFKESITLRLMTDKELEQHVPALAPANRQAVDRRAGDLIKGAGQGGGGNPMKAGEARGTTSGTTQPAGGAAATSGTPTGSTTSKNVGR